MTFVVTGNCTRCRYTDCVVICPVDCFHGDDEMLYIDPDGCIDCGACVPVCPVDAIYDEGGLPEEDARWLVLNAQRAPSLPIVNRRQAPLQTAYARALERGFKPSE